MLFLCAVPFVRRPTATISRPDGVWSVWTVRSVPYSGVQRLEDVGVGSGRLVRVSVGGLLRRVLPGL